MKSGKNKIIEAEILKAINIHFDLYPEYFQKDGIFSIDDKPISKVSRAVSSIRDLIFVLNKDSKYRKSFATNDFRSLGLMFYLPGLYMANYDVTYHDANIKIGDIRHVLFKHITITLKKALYIQTLVSIKKKKKEAIIDADIEKLVNKLNAMSDDDLEKYFSKYKYITKKHKYKGNEGLNEHLKNLGWDEKVLLQELNLCPDNNHKFVTANTNAFQNPWLCEACGESSIFSELHISEDQFELYFPKRREKLLDEFKKLVPEEFHAEFIPTIKINTVIEINDTYYRAYLLNIYKNKKLQDFNRKYNHNQSLGKFPIMIKLWNFQEERNKQGKEIPESHIVKLISIEDQNVADFIINNYDMLSEWFDKAKLEDLKLNIVRNQLLSITVESITEFIKLNYNYLYHPTSGNRNKVIELVKKSQKLKLNDFGISTPDLKELTFYNHNLPFIKWLSQYYNYAKSIGIISYSELDQHNIENIIKQSYYEDSHIASFSRLMFTDHLKFDIKDDKLKNIKYRKQKAAAALLLAILAFSTLYLEFSLLNHIFSSKHRNYIQYANSTFHSWRAGCLIVACLMYNAVIVIPEYEPEIRDSFNNSMITAKDVSLIIRMGANVLMPVQVLKDQFKPSEIYIRDANILRYNYVSAFAYNAFLGWAFTVLLESIHNSKLEEAILQKHIAGLSFAQAIHVQHHSLELVEDLQKIQYGFSNKTKVIMLGVIVILSYLSANLAVHANQDPDNKHSKIRKAADVILPHQSFVKMIRGNREPDTEMAFTEKLDIKAIIPAQLQLV